MKKNKRFSLLVFPFLVFSFLLACSLPSIQGLNPGSSGNNGSTPTLATTSGKLTLTTGNDGSEINPTFELMDHSGAVIFSMTLDNPGDLQPNQTDIYEFIVEKPFCQIVGWKLYMPPSAADDPWQAASDRLELNGIAVWWDNAASSMGFITTSNPLNGYWEAGTPFQQECGE